MTMIEMRLHYTANISEFNRRDWAVVAEYEKEPIGSDSDDYKRIGHPETRALKKNNTEKSKSSAFNAHRPSGIHK